MANQWLRLWHEMPTDPKWRTIARVSGESIALVTAVYMHMLVSASRNVTRGHVNVTAEDLASALDVTDQQVEAVLSAMEGRVIEFGVLSGWDKRQPKREDSGDDFTGAKSSVQRKKDQRDREKAASQPAAITAPVAQCHDVSRNVTTDKDKDGDKDKEEEEITTHNPPVTPTMAGAVCVALKVEGVGDVNPGHPSLLALIGAGADVGTFVAAVRGVKDSANKRFAYVLGIVKRQMADAASLADQALARPLVADATPRQTESFAERDERIAAERYREATGQTTPKPMGEVIDIAPKRITK